jgi:hypothetical protein
MGPRVIALVPWAMVALGACTGGEARRPVPTPAAPSTAAAGEIEPAPTATEPTATEPTATTNQENAMSGGAVSPSGERHPGEIVHEDKIDGRTWTKAAHEVPVGIAWVELNKVWEPVLRIEITGTAGQRRITKFGKDGKLLESTIQQRRPPPR